MPFFITFNCKFPVTNIKIFLMAKNIKWCFHISSLESFHYQNKNVSLFWCNITAYHSFTQPFQYITSRCSFCFFLFRVCWRFTEQEGKRVEHLYSSLPLPPTHKQSLIYLQPCMCYEYHIFLIELHIITRLLLSTFLNYQLIHWWWTVTFYLLDDLILDFITATLAKVSNGFEP